MHSPAFPRNTPLFYDLIQYCKVKANPGWEAGAPGHQGGGGSGGGEILFILYENPNPEKRDFHGKPQSHKHLALQCV